MRSSQASTRQARRRCSCRCRRIPTSRRRRSRRRASSSPRATARRCEPTAEWDAYFADAGDRPVHLEATPSYFYGGAAVAEAMRDPPRRPARAGRVARAGEPRHLVLHLPEDPAALPRRLPDRRLPRGGRPAHAGRLRRPRQREVHGVPRRLLRRLPPGWFDTLGTDHVRVIDFAPARRRPGRPRCTTPPTWLGLDPARFPADALSSENRTTGFKNKGFQRVALAGNDKLETRAAPPPRAQAQAARVLLPAQRASGRGARSPTRCAPSSRRATRSRTRGSPSSSTPPGCHSPTGSRLPPPSVPASIDGRIVAPPRRRFGHRRERDEHERALEHERHHRRDRHAGVVERVPEHRDDREREHRLADDRHRAVQRADAAAVHSPEVPDQERRRRAGPRAAWCRRTTRGLRRACAGW